MTGMSNDTDSTRFGKHREQLKPEIKRSEAAVQQTLDAVHGFLNPFDILGKHHFHILSSGNPAPPDVETDALKAEKAGRIEKEKFVLCTYKKACRKMALGKRQIYLTGSRSSILKLWRKQTRK